MTTQLVNLDAAKSQYEGVGSNDILSNMLNAAVRDVLSNMSSHMDVKLLELQTELADIKEKINAILNFVVEQQSGKKKATGGVVKTPTPPTTEQPVDTSADIAAVTALPVATGVATGVASASVAPGSTVPVTPAPAKKGRPPTKAKTAEPAAADAAAPAPVAIVPPVVNDPELEANPIAGTPGKEYHNKLNWFKSKYVFESFRNKVNTVIGAIDQKNTKLIADTLALPINAKKDDASKHKAVAGVIWSDVLNNKENAVTYSAINQLLVSIYDKEKAKTA